MKKIVMAAAAAALMATSAMAIDGTVTGVVLNPNAPVAKICVTDANPTTFCKNVDITSDFGKAMYASALTAKAAGDAVTAFHNGTSWNYFEVK